MPEPTFYAQLTRTTVDMETWDEAYFALVAMKQALASLPGFVGMEILGRADDDGVDVVTVVRWALEDQLEVWLSSGYTPSDLYAVLQSPPERVVIDYMLEMG